MSPKRPTTLVVAALLASTALSAASCGSEADRLAATKAVTHANDTDGTVPKEEVAPLAPKGQVGVAGPDGQMIEGASIDVPAMRKRSIEVLDRMLVLKTDPTEEQSKAFMFVYGPTPVVDDGSGKTIGYWVGRFLTVAEYEAALPEQQRIVDAAS